MCMIVLASSGPSLQLLTEIKLLSKGVAGDTAQEKEFKAFWIH